MAAAPNQDPMTLDYFKFYQTLPTYGKSKSGELTGEELWTYNAGLALIRKCETAVLEGKRLPPNAMELEDDRVQEQTEYTEEIALLDDEERELTRRLEAVRKQREDRIARRAQRNKMYMRLIDEDIELEINRIKSFRS